MVVPRPSPVALPMFYVPRTSLRLGRGEHETTLTAALKCCLNVYYIHVCHFDASQFNTPTSSLLFVLGCMRSAECLVSAGCTPRPVAAVLHPGGSVCTPRFSLTAPVRLVGRWGCALLAVGRGASTVLRIDSLTATHVCIYVCVGKYICMCIYVLVCIRVHTY